MIDWLRFPPDWPEMEDEGRLVDAVVDEGDVFALVTGRLVFVQMMESDEDPSGVSDLPLFNVVTQAGGVYSFHDVVEFRFIEVQGSIH